MEPPSQHHDGDGGSHDDDHDDGASASASAPAPQGRPKQRPSPQPHAAAPPPSLIPIDDLLDAAASALPFGGLLHGPLFSLHDAMLAVEVGDPKLDAGAARGGEPTEDKGGAMQSTSSTSTTSTSTSTSTSARTASARLSATDAVAALDGLAAAEAAWLAGGCLGTTVLTCLFMLRPQQQSVTLSRRGDGTTKDGGGGGDGENLDLVNVVIRAATSATRAAVSAARSLVTRAGVCEDEDFQLFQQAMPPAGGGGGKGESGCCNNSSGGGDGGDGGDDQKEEAEALLNEAEEKLKAISSGRSSSSPPFSVASSLALRLRFRRATLRALRAAEGAAATERSSAALAAAVADALGALGELEKEGGGAEAAAAAAAAAVIPSPSSSTSTSPSPQQQQQQQQFPLDALPGFDSAAARRELPPAPPRPDRAFDVRAGRAYWRKLLSDLSAVASFPESVAREEGEEAEVGEEEEEEEQRRHQRRRWHLRGALRAVRAFAARGAGAVPRSALALVLGLALDATASSSGNSGNSKNDDDKSNGGGGEEEGSEGSSSDNPYVSESSVRDALHLPQDPTAAPFRSLAAAGAGAGAGGEGGPGSNSNPHPPPPPPPSVTMAAKFVEQAVLGLQGWCVAALLNPCRARRRHRRCLEDWVHVHQHAVNAEGDEGFARWLEGGDGWDWRLPAASAAATGKGNDDGGGDDASAAPLPPPPMSPSDAAIVDHASPLSCWVEEQACRAQRDHLLSGFALDLYAPHEAAAVLLVAEHLERRAEGAAGALAERYPCPRSCFKR